MRSLLLVPLFAALAAGPAYAQPADARREASEHFQRARALEAGGDFRGAIAEYLRAYEEVPHPDVLYNVARDYERVKEWALAITYYRRYLAEREEPPADAGEVKARIAELEGKQADAGAAGTPEDSGNGAAPAGAGAPPRGALSVAKPSAPGDAAGTASPGGPAVSGEASPPPAGRLWRFSASYGLAVGDTVIERYRIGAGLRTRGGLLEALAIAGTFGKNDLGLGLEGRAYLSGRKVGPVPFVSTGVTVGYAREDASSSAAIRVPLGLEIGAGAYLGRKNGGGLYATLGARLTAGGFGAEDTLADGSVNDRFAILFDAGAIFGR